MLEQYLSSLELLLPYDIDVVIPSHGTRFEDHRAVIAATAQHHEERCGVILGHISGTPMTAHEIVLAVWRGKLSPFHHHFALYEIMAHLEYMSRRGRAIAETRTAGALEWRPAA